MILKVLTFKNQMNIIHPILTCDCCAGFGLIRTCKLKNCNYKMCQSCKYTYYIKQNNTKCPACRRNIYERKYCLSWFKTFFIKIKQKFVHRNSQFINKILRYISLCCNYEMYRIYFLTFLTIIAIFFYACIFRLIYHIHCDIIFPFFCNEPFLSKYFILLAFFGICIAYIYYLIYLFIRGCASYYIEDF